MSWSSLEILHNISLNMTSKFVPCYFDKLSTHETHVKLQFVLFHFSILPISPIRNIRPRMLLNNIINGNDTRIASQNTQNHIKAPAYKETLLYLIMHSIQHKQVGITSTNSICIKTSHSSFHQNMEKIPSKTLGMIIISS